jgi:hypothetical protein
VPYQISLKAMFAIKPMIKGTAHAYATFRAIRAASLDKAGHT